MTHRRWPKPDYSLRGQLTRAKTTIEQQKHEIELARRQTRALLADVRRTLKGLQIEAREAMLMYHRGCGQFFKWEARRNAQAAAWLLVDIRRAERRLGVDA